MYTCRCIYIKYIYIYTYIHTHIHTHFFLKLYSVALNESYQDWDVRISLGFRLAQLLMSPLFPCSHILPNMHGTVMEPILPITAILKRRWWDDSEDHSDFDRLDDCNGRGPARSVSEWVIISCLFVFFKWIRIRTMIGRWLHSKWHLSSLSFS